ncbi:MAG: pirin family protein, partial [Pseudolabrys sp.]
MSFFPGKDPAPGNAAQSDAIVQVIAPRTVDLGDFSVRRALPSAQTRLVGPFIFFDHFGPAVFRSGQGIDVRPHPHIGLATVTYLFEGEVFHRDSLGSAVAIRPGEVNLMSAGRGVVHSERERSEVRGAPHRLFGIQAWAALPRSHEETAPSFEHHGTDALPRIGGEGKRVRLVLGEAYGASSPVEFPHATLFAEAVLAPGAVLPLDPDYDERAIYVASGEIDIAGDRFGDGRLLVFKPGDRISVLALSNARLILLGGEPMDGPRHIWWNLVSSSQERIE